MSESRNRKVVRMATAERKAQTPAATDIPRGIEVLVKKASVDPEFKRLLLEKRAGAAQEIDLDLNPAEAAMLASIPAAQLESIVERTHVSQESRAAFLGRAAALMLAALGAGTIACNKDSPAPTGIAPDRPAAATKTPSPAKPDQQATMLGLTVREPTPTPTPTKPPFGQSTRNTRNLSRGIQPDRVERVKKITRQVKEMGEK